MKNYFAASSPTAITLAFAGILCACSLATASHESMPNPTRLTELVQMHWMGNPEQAVQQGVERALFADQKNQLRPISREELQKLGFQCPDASTLQCVFDWSIVRQLKGLPAKSKASANTRIDIKVSIDASIQPPKIVVVRTETDLP